MRTTICLSTVTLAAGLALAATIFRRLSTSAKSMIRT